MKSKKKTQQKRNKGLYYNLNWILSKNRLFSAVIGLRGGGKSYSSTKYVIKKYLTKHTKSVWMRRYAVELDEVFLDKFFVDMEMNNEFPDYEFKCSKKDITGVAYGMCRKKDCGGQWEKFIIFMPLSICLKHKSVVMSDYDFVVCDEWFIDTINTNLRYIKGWNEPYIFKEFFESIARKRADVRVLFISNAFSTVNPYFTEWGVKLDNNTEWWSNKFVVIHNYKNDQYKQEKLKTQWGQYLANTEYGKYNMDNQFLLDSEDFIAYKTKKSKWQCNIAYEGKVFGLWIDRDEGKVFISWDKQKDGKTFCFTGKDLKPNYYMLWTVRSDSNWVSKLINDAIRYSYLYFEDQELKSLTYSLLALWKV